MIWESIPLMTVFDVLIAAVAVAALRILYVHRRELVHANLLLGVSIVIVGLLIIGLFYFADLFVMWVMPLITSSSAAMAMMADLHLNYSWPLMLLCTLCIFVGFTHTIRGLLAQTAESKKKTAQLEEANRDLYREINERTQVEAALRKNEQRYRAVVETQTEFISRSLPDTTLTFVNEAYCTYFGRKAHDVIGQSFLSLVAPEAREAARAHFASLVEAPRQIVYEHEVLLPDGSRAWNEWIDTPILDEAGRVVEFQSVGRDITERKRAQEALQESEERYRRLVERAPVPISVFRMDGTLCYVNEATLEMLGASSPEEIVGTTVYEYIEESERETAKARAQQLEQGKDVQLVERTLIRRNGEKRHVVIASLPIKYQGQPAAQSIVLDITERKQAEEALRESEARYRTFISNSYVGIWRIETRPPIPLDLPLKKQVKRVLQDAYFAECNDAAAQMLGYESAKDVIGKCYGEVIPPSEAPNRAVLYRIVEAEYNMVDAEFREVNHQGRLMISLNSFFSTIKEGCVVQSWGIGIDITERKRAEEALRESEARYRALYTKTPVMLHSTDAQGRLLSVSDYWLESLGYTREDVLGRPSAAFLTEASRQYAETTCFPAFQRMGILKDEPLQFQKKDGEVIDILLSAIAERDTDGNRIRSLVVAVDVTERKRAEEALQRSEEKFATAFRASPDSVMISSLEDGRLVEVNESFLKATGYRREEVINRTALDLNLWIDPDDRERMAELLRSQKTMREFETRFRMKSGEVRNGQLSAGLIDLDGERCLLSVTRDITDRKRAEEKLREFTERLKILREIDRAILAAESPESIAQVGLQHVHQLVPCSYANVVIFDDETQEARLIAIEPDIGVPDGRSMEDVAGFLDLERMRQGQVHRIADTTDLPAKPMMQFINTLGLRSLLNVPLLAQGRLIGTLNIGFDQPGAYSDQHVEITREVADSLAVAIEHARLFGQVREANVRLHSLSGQLVQAQEAERRHLARELHDQIGQTLTAVKLSLQAVRGRTNDASDLDEHIQIVSDALNEVRTLSLDLRPSMLDDLGLVPALRWFVERQTRQAGFEGRVVVSNLENRLPAELEVTCFRVVQEALTNIARHAEARRVDVAVHRQGEVVELVVKDDGKGFDVEQALKRAAAGTSLGLLGMEERVHLAGGELAISSRQGQGTEVRVCLPVSM